MDDAAINKIRAQISEFETRLEQGRDAQRKISVAIAEVNNAPPSREECLSSFEAALAPLAGHDIPKIEQWFRRWIDVEPSEREKDIAFNIGPRVANCDWENFIRPLLWPVLRTQIADAINNMDWPGNALNAAERQQRLKALEPQRIAAEAALNVLESQAQKLGIR
ncbi:MAG TPA: hypothetical protein P5102_15220 [Candidatus Competibacteraceae bacterium]|nr:hypothetical protein [Candidatus Competibacteraceae bacterium]HSA47756.1 hypothetical protein [Candidatus Competibacteraceae bacterium]